MEEGNKRIRDMGILDWIYCIRAENSPAEYALWVSLQDTHFTKGTQ